MSGVLVVGAGPTLLELVLAHAEMVATAAEWRRLPQGEARREAAERTVYAARRVRLLSMNASAVLAAGVRA
jgi:hypothetical protein